MEHDKTRAFIADTTGQESRLGLLGFSFVQAVREGEDSLAEGIIDEALIYKEKRRVRSFGRTLEVPEVFQGNIEEYKRLLDDAHIKRVYEKERLYYSGLNAKEYSGGVRSPFDVL
jgi:hypothetical protein